MNIKAVVNILARHRLGRCLFENFLPKIEHYLKLSHMSLNISRPNMVSFTICRYCR